MSWNSGAQPTYVESASLRNATRIISRLAITLAWLTITPLGSEVEPEVYCRNAVAASGGSSGTNAGSPPKVSASTAMTSTARAAGSSASWARVNSA